MLAMDVVDTLRHRQLLVEQELAGEERDEAMLERLRRIYAAQGIEVPDRILREGVTALREDRFAYRPPPDTWAVWWARVYAQRARWAWVLLGVVVVAALAWGAYRVGVVAPREARLEGIDNRHAAIQQLAADDAVRQRADVLQAQALAAAGAGDMAEADALLGELTDLQARLERSYELVIDTGPDAVAGVWRVPELNATARNYYLIVEAIGEQGEAVTLPIENEETGEVERVSTFGLRVDEATWDRVATDLDDDGIIQERTVAVKRRGELEPEYRVDTSGAAITQW